MHSIPACLVYNHRLKLWTMETVLVWSCIISLIVIVGIPFQNVHRVIFKLLKIPWSCALEGKFIEKIIHCVLKINIDVNILLDLTKVL